ncbi:MAG: twin-arginine translocase subunit TatC [Deltaproteobacteria bacterium]|nr:twin-arginine translocase subunit TatC [Deltaproteobacteria bacterium]
MQEKQTFIEHLEDLRKRLIISLIAVGIGFIICYLFSKEIFEFLMMPLHRALPTGATMIFTTPAEAFFTYMKVGLLAGVFAASPIVLYQIWLFVAPALYSKEKKYVIPFVCSSTILFVGGAAFGYFVIFPLSAKFFMSFTTDFIQPAPRLKESFSFCAMLLLTFGLTFELPIFILFLSKLGVLDARMLARNRKYVIILIFIVAAILTPPDPLSQVMMAVPLVALYEVSIWVAKIFGRRPSAEGRKPKARGKKKKVRKNR